MKRLAFAGGVTGLGALALLLASQLGHAEPWTPSALVAEPMADINDVYTWMDGERLTLAMSISPVDEQARAFGPGVQYVFHVHSKAGIGVFEAGTGIETRVICTFQSNTSAQCWVVDAGGQVRDYLTGDPSDPAGLTSASGAVRLFAGRRSDPRFFNLQGFRAAVTAIRGVTQTRDAAGCPSNLSNGTVQNVVAQLGAANPMSEPPCPANQRDCFLDLNVRVVVVQLDKSLVNAAPNHTVGVWASTHAGPRP